MLMGLFFFFLSVLLLSGISTSSILGKLNELSLVELVVTVLFVGKMKLGI